MGIYYNTRIVRDGLVLHLDAANVKSYPVSGTTWADLSGNGNNATQNGTASLASWNSNGYFEHRPLNYFGAANSSSSASSTAGSWWIVPHSNSLSPNNGFWSVCGWLKVIGDQTGNGTGWFHKKGASDERGIHLEPVGGSFRTNASNGWSQINYNINNTGVWAFFCFTFRQITGTYGTDPGILNMYINGQYVTQDTDFRPSPDSGAVIWLGRRNGHLRHFFNGDIATYTYYSKALSDSQVTQNFEAHRGRFGL